MNDEKGKVHPDSKENKINLWNRHYVGFKEESEEVH